MLTLEHMRVAQNRTVSTLTGGGGGILNMTGATLLLTNT